MSEDGGGQRNDALVGSDHFHPGRFSTITARGLGRFSSIPHHPECRGSRFPHRRRTRGGSVFSDFSSAESMTGQWPIGLHVAGSPAKAGLLFRQHKRVGVPGLAFHRNHIGASGEDDPSFFHRTEVVKIGLGSFFIRNSLEEIPCP